MTAIAATGRRLTKQYGEGINPQKYNLAVTAGKHVKAGSLVALVTAGTCEPATAATGLVALGRADDDYDNSASLSPAPVARITTGIFGWAQTGTTITEAHIGTTVYMADDQTVTLSSTSASPAGTCVGIGDDGTTVLVATSPLLPITSNGYALQSRTVTLVGGASTGSKLGTAAGVGTGADTDNTNRVYPVGAIMPAGAMYAGHAIHLVTPFTNPGSSLALTIGGADDDGIVSAFDLVGSAAGYYDGTAGAQNIEASRLAALKGQQVTATLNPDAADKVSESTVGEVKITVFFIDATDY